jgi:hypothetical protein
MKKRQSNRPDRRLAPADQLDCNSLENLFTTVQYVGSAYHKLRASDYQFHPPSNPRPTKSLCDDRGPIPRDVAILLFQKGIKCGMVSVFTADVVPKYVWAVDDQGEVFEAKCKPGQDTKYHGYRLGDDDRDMRDLIKREWKIRCQRY